MLNRDIDEEQAREWWFPEPPGRTVVAVDDGRNVDAAGNVAADLDQLRDAVAEPHVLDVDLPAPDDEVGGEQPLPGVRRAEASRRCQVRLRPQQTETARPSQECRR